MASPVALVTGGGSGIGFAVAEHLIKFHGYKVAILDINEERVQEAAVKLGDNCLALQVDITDYNAQAKAFLQTWEWAGCRLDLVFLNAGIADADSLYTDSNGIDPQTGIPPPLDLRVYDVNLSAVTQGIHLARHFFSEKNSSTKGGRIVVTASMVGLYPMHSIPMYTASKHALIGLVRSLAPVYAKDGITVNALCPAMIDTNIMPEAMKALWDPKQWTPLSTALTAIDMVIANEKLTGKAMELSLERLVLKPQPEYSTENIRWACEQHTLWEMVAESRLPRKPGQNTDLKDAS